MSLVQLYVPTEVSRDVMHQIGSLSLIQFRDLNSKVNEFQRAFVKELRKLDNIERQYNFFKKELDKKNIEIRRYPYREFEEVASQNEIDEFAENGNLLEGRLSQLIDSLESLYEKEKDLKEFRYTIQSVEDFFGSYIIPGNDSNEEDAVLSRLEGGGVDEAHSPSFISGVINRNKVALLEQILWRVLRGNLYFHSEEISEKLYDSKTGENVDKNTFIIFSYGSLIFERIRKICESLDAELYSVDYNSELRTEQLNDMNVKLSDLSSVLSQSEFALDSELIAISKDLAKWWEIIAREKAVYQTMNKCDYDDSRKTLVAEGWVPTDQIENLSKKVKSSIASEAVPTIINVLHTTKTPPTFHRTNKFTTAFQNLCDAYGIATYREINPGLPTIITFPFMFAIMFGDMGHGFLMFLAALALVLNEKKLAPLKKDEIFDMAFTGRYVLLLMGFFSMYTGFLYNDLFSKSMTLFKSGWKWPENFEIGETIYAKKVGVYIFGMDPTWHGTENALLFTNSYKMKLSILMGYLHMTYSYFFSLVNHLHFKSVIDIIGNFIPGLLFMQGIFGYLSLCIVYKWVVDWHGIGQQPPGLLNTLISMFLAPGTVTEPLYRGQSKVQVMLLLIALICVPWLLLVKPLYFRQKFAREAKEAQYQSLPTNEESEHNAQDEDEEHGEHSFGDIMIHQVIHTIEFCLNCVSHTASYLRLWALSLAHAQLSTVLWSMTIGGVFGMKGAVGVMMIVFAFAMWFTLTVVILVLMEGTSAMLHSLRLHWVESMSKFFEGEGTLYEPFKFKDLLNDIF